MINTKKLFLAMAVFCCAVVFAQAHALAQGGEDERTAGTKPEASVGDTSETYRQLNLFGDVFERVRDQYVDEVTDEKLVESAINGMLVSLDPHSSYLDDDDYEEMQVQTRGEFGGLGIEVTMESGVVKVVSPIDDTPAFRAGIQAGDYITHLDDAPIVGLTLGEAVDKMRGPVGSSVKLTIRRENTPEPVNVDIVRDVIKIKSVKSETLDDSIAYVRISTFNQNAGTGLESAIADIKAKLGDHLQGVILDLRNNPGGLLDQAIAVSDAFLEKGEIVSTRGRHDYDTKRDNATSGDVTGGLPVVVLINGGSASASEIVAGALQDHKRAIVIGTQSFGKGSVQTVIPLPGHGAMRLTTARYYTPSGRSIQAKGIAPDIIVEQAKVEKIAGAASGISESDLRGALANPDDSREEKAGGEAAAKDKKGGDKNGKDEKRDRSDKNSALPGKENAAPEKEGTVNPAEDYQLSRAMDLIRGISLYESSRDTPSADPSTPESEEGAAAVPPAQPVPSPAGGETNPGPEKPQ